MMWDVIPDSVLARAGSGSVVYDSVFVVDVPAEQFAQKIKEVGAIISQVIRENPDYDFTVTSLTGGQTKLSWVRKRTTWN